MLLPYNVDRTTRAVPVVTWTLIAINIFVFLLSVTATNLSRDTDREAGVAAIETTIASDAKTQQVLQSVAQNNASPDAEKTIGAEEIRDYKQYRALRLASQDIRSLEGYQKIWQIEHAYDGPVFEPHWSFLNLFAYHVSGTAPLARFFSMFSAMFLHANLEHIAGNLLFLWIFGRATEEFLGWRFFLSIYTLSGLGATVFDHLMTLIFAPASAGIPQHGRVGSDCGRDGTFRGAIFPH